MRKSKTRGLYLNSFMFRKSKSCKVDYRNCSTYRCRNYPYNHTIKNVIVSKFNEKAYEQVYVKSSTGFYKTPNDQPNGANVHVITLMLENATPLNVKASGGIKTREDAIQMIQMGVKRIGTSSHLAIVE